MRKRESYVPKTKGLGRSMKVRVNMTFEIISPEEGLVHHDIEACPTSYWIKQLLPSVLPFLFLRQIEKALACSKQLLPQCLRHPMID